MNTNSIDFGLCYYGGFFVLCYFFPSLIVFNLFLAGLVLLVFPIVMLSSMPNSPVERIPEDIEKEHKDEIKALVIAYSCVFILLTCLFLIP